MSINRQYFSKEQIEAGEMKKLLDFLLSDAYGEGDHYNDIHIYPEDLGAFSLEWIQVPWDHSYGGKFEYIDEDADQVVMLDKLFPDNHSELCYSEADYEERLDDWLKENEGWEKNKYGHWYYKPDQEAWEKAVSDPHKEVVNEEIEKVRNGDRD